MQYPFRNTLPYFVTQISAVMTDIVSQHLDQYGISIPVYRVLVVLRDGEVRTLSELARIIEIDQSTLSRQVGAMARGGLITRVRPDDNGRIVRIEITAEGKRIVGEAIPFVQDLEAVALDSLSADEVDGLKLSLRRVQDNLIALRDASLSTQNAGNDSVSNGSSYPGI